MEALLNLGVGVGGFALFYAVLKFFKTIEDGLNVEAKQRISSQLRGRNSSTIIVEESSDDDRTGLAETFADIFDRVFTKKHFSLRCFLRSWLASTVSIILITLIAGLVRLQEWIDGSPPFQLDGGELKTLPFLFLMIVLPDYLSLLESRWIIRRMRHKRLSVVASLLSADFFLTAIIALLATTFWISLFWLALGPLVFGEAMGSKSVLSYGSDLFDRLIHEGLYLSDIPDPISVGVFFYSTFFTSIWVWLYASSAFLIKLFVKLRIGINFLSGTLDIEGKPLQSIGLVCGASVALLYWSFLLIKLVFSAG